MEPQTPTFDQSHSEFLPGTQLIYGLHGKCNFLGTDSRMINGKSVYFYKLEIKKSALSRSNRQDPAIWVPVATAREQGLRLPMNKAEAEKALQLLSSREYFFQINDNWTQILPQLETTLRLEGGAGLAKVASYLHVLKRKQVVPSRELNKFQETVHRLLFRELSDALGEPAKTLEERVVKGFRAKLLPDI